LDANGDLRLDFKGGWPKKPRTGRERGGFGDSDSALGSCHLFLGLLFLGVAMFRTTQLILIVDLELLRGFGALVHGADRRLILTRMFIGSVIVVIFGASRRVRGENQTLKLP
jgi:hypothetical protein